MLIAYLWYREYRFKKTNFCLSNTVTGHTYSYTMHISEHCKLEVDWRPIQYLYNSVVGYELDVEAYIMRGVPVCPPHVEQTLELLR